MKVGRTRRWLMAAFVSGALVLSPAALRGQSVGQRVDQEFSALHELVQQLRDALADLAQRVRELPTPPPPVTTPPPTGDAALTPRVSALEALTSALAATVPALEARVAALETPQPVPAPTPASTPVLRPFDVPSVQALLLSQRDTRVTGKDCSFGDSLTVTRAYRRADAPLPAADLATFDWMHGRESGDANGFTLAGGEALTARSGAGWGDAWIDDALASPRVTNCQFIDWLFNSVPDLALVQKRVDQAEALGAVSILWTVPPRVAPNAPDYDEVYTKPHNARLIALCNARGQIACIDLYAAFVANPNWRTELVSADGVHLTLAGYDLRTKLLVEMVGEIKRLAIDTLPPPVPTPVPVPTPTPTPEPPPTGSLRPLQASDLTFLGQVDTPGTRYVGQNLAMRYVGGERRFLAFTYGSTGGGSAQDTEQIGDLYEYRVTAPLKNGDQHWTDANVPGWTPVRRWKNWTTAARMITAGTYPNVFKVAGQSGVMPAGFYWDEAHGVLWYSLLPQYGGGSPWPAWNAVKLTDDEANGNVSDAHIYGPFYFKDKTTPDLFKDSSSGMTAIDPSRQASMAGTHIIEGHHSALIGNRGARSIGFWVVNGLPDPATLSPGAVLWPDAYHLYDTSSGSGKPAPNVHKPNFAKNASYHGGNSQMGKLVSGGVVAPAMSGTPIGLAVDDCIYTTEEPYVYLDTVSIFMDKGAAGGAWVPEIYNGTSWVQPAGWKVSVGDTALSQPENVFYWPKTPYSYAAEPDRLINGGGYGYRYVRLRRTAPGTSGGAIASALATISMVGQSFGKDNDLPLPGTGYVGGYVRPGSGTPQYDASHYSYSLVEAMWGGAWVKTPNVEGLAYFGAVGSGGYHYGPMPVYAQPETGGVPIKYESANLPATDVSSESGGIAWSNGPRYEGSYRSYFLPFNSADLLAAAADPAKRFSDFLNPASYTELYAGFPGLIPQTFVTNPRVANEPYFGEPRATGYFSGASTIFDPVTNQLIVMIPTIRDKNILAFFQVR